MSSPTNVEEDQQVFIAICCDVSADTLLVYEYLITFDREYQLVWKRPFSAATLVFLLARYIILLQNIIQLPTIYPLSTGVQFSSYYWRLSYTQNSQSCSVLVWLGVVLGLLFTFLAAAFSCLRAYALSGRRRQIASLVFILSLVPFGAQLFTSVRQVVVVAPPPINCTTVSLISSELANTLVYVARATIITIDVLVLAVTVHQTYWRSQGAAEATLRTPLHTLILRDGTIYFLALLILNIADIILLYLGETFEEASYIGYFIDPITTIIISRFMLNLREINAPINSSEDPSQSSSSRSVRLTTFVEPFGAPLDHEFEFPSMDSNNLDDEEADQATGAKNALRCDEEITSGQATVRGLSEVSSVVENNV